MKAILLSAGLGTRLRPITDTIPKCLVPIHGKPLLAYWFDLLCQNGIDEILVNTHYLAEEVHSFVVNSSWQNQIKLTHEMELLGTAGTVLKNKDFIGIEPCLLAHADNLTQFDVRAFIAKHQARPSAVEITMMTFDTDSPMSCGIVEQNEAGIVTALYEKSLLAPKGNPANAAVYILEPSIIDFLESLQKEYIDFSTEVLPHYIGKMQTFHNVDYHRDIGTPESLQLAHDEFLREF